MMRMKTASASSVSIFCLLFIECSLSVYAGRCHGAPIFNHTAPCAVKRAGIVSDVGVGEKFELYKRPRVNTIIRKAYAPEELSDRSLRSGSSGNVRGPLRGR